jgi:uncharacterized membrane protein
MSEKATRKPGISEKQSPQDLAYVVERNIKALLELRQQDENEKSTQERVADFITRFAGSMSFVYLHLVIFGLWVVTNLGWLPIKKFDPSFVVLAMFASVEAIFLSTFVLISQNRMQQVADKRADLDLHVSLLAEHEITRLITLVRAMATQMGVEEVHAPELTELEKDIHPERVMSEIKDKEIEHNKNS